MGCYASSGYYGINYAFDNTASADIGRWAKWTPDIKEADIYDIYIRWISLNDSPIAVPLEIKYNGGIDNTKIINQKHNSGVWVYIGSYPLSEGTENYVKIHASSQGRTSADAVKFVAQNAMGNEEKMFL